jgi:hypothetical protein
MLSHAFESLNVNRVELTVDSRNVASLAAVKKLGAVQEGILRQHKILESGYVRDTVLFSIIRPEWPAVKIGLQIRLIALDNPDLPVEFIRELLMSKNMDRSLIELFELKKLNTPLILQHSTSTI